MKTGAESFLSKMSTIARHRETKNKKVKYCKVVPIA
jgi:hypothetical protein